MESDASGRRRRAVLVSALFMVAGPGTVLAGAAASVITSAFARFVREGLGTPIPAAAPTELVVGGIYRYVRNPMYLANATARESRAGCRACGPGTRISRWAITRA